MPILTIFATTWLAAWAAPFVQVQEAKLSMIGVFAVAGLLLVAILAVGTVLLAANRSFVPWRQIGAVLSVLLWVVPAVGVVALVATRATRSGAYTDHPVIPTPQAVQAEPHVIQVENRVVEAPQTSATRLTMRKFSHGPESQNVEIKDFVGGRELVSLSSQRFATLEEAEDQITEQAREAVKKKYRSEFPLAGDFEVPLAVLDKFAVKESLAEVMDKDFGNNIKGKMYRTHVKLDFSPELQAALHGSWQREIAHHRLLILGSITGLVTLMLSTAAGYFRLDDLTGGAYRRRLKLAAAAVVGAGSLVAATFIA